MNNLTFYSRKILCWQVQNCDEMYVDGIKTPILAIILCTFLVKHYSNIWKAQI
jgi:hypothetical protein